MKTDTLTNNVYVISDYLSGENFHFKFGAIMKSHKKIYISFEWYKFANKINILFWV